MNVGILFTDFGPYHAARIEALAVALKRQKSQLTAFQFHKSSVTYGWRPVMPAGVEVVTLTEKPVDGIIGAFKIAMALRQAMQTRNIEAVFLPSYSPLPNLFCLLVAKYLGQKTILMLDSWEATERAGFVGRLMKHMIIQSFDAALVAGTPHREYVCSYGQKRSRVFLGYDVVDVNYFAEESKRWKDVAVEDLPIPNLPKRYFLNLGRFASKKNLALLIRAYAQFVQQNPAKTIALVLVGEGSEENVLRQLALALNLRVRSGLETACDSADVPEVVFYPYQQVDTTPLFFARCEAFILPSLYEEWGLVINEAMACGAAVLVSEKVGCVQDLVEEGKNGFRFNPTDVDELCGLLERFVRDPTLARHLGAHGAHLIRRWSPERFVEGALNAIQSLNIESLTMLLKVNV